jgi:hypothetical protein
MHLDGLSRRVAHEVPFEFPDACGLRHDRSSMPVV